MALHRIKRGLDLPIAGTPVQEIEAASACSRVALIAQDYVGMRPTMLVKPGDLVRRGQAVFEDKKTPGVLYTSPAAGSVVALNRGEQRAFQSLVIALNEREMAHQPSEDDFARFENYTGSSVSAISGEQVKALLIESGLWTAIRGRPYGRVANPQVTPRAIFVNAMDTNPLAPSPQVALKGREQDFQIGVQCLSKLTEGKTFVCRAPGAAIPVPSDPRVQAEEFAGPHPAGTVGVHIHTLSPVSREKTAWYLNYQDAAAIGRLFTTGRLDVERVISLAGPTVKRPRLLRTRVGAFLDGLVRDELQAGENRVVSGSVLSGRTAMGAIFGYLGRYHLQVSALREGRERPFLGWARPGLTMYSVIPTCLSALFSGRKWSFTTATNGSGRAMVPIGLYERVMPMDIQPTYLLRSLVMHDVERAEQLGVLELEEEDVALCTLVCPGKTDFGPILRDNLSLMEKEG